MIDNNALTAQDKNFLRTMRDSGVPAPEAYKRLEAIKIKPVSLPPLSPKDNYQDKSIDGDFSTISPTSLRGRIESAKAGAKESLETGVESFKRGVVPSEEGQTFGEFAQKTVLPTVGGLAKGTVGQISGAVGGFFKPELERGLESIKEVAGTVAQVVPDEQREKIKQSFLKVWEGVTPETKQSLIDIANTLEVLNILPTGFLAERFAQKTIGGLPSAIEDVAKIGKEVVGKLSETAITLRNPIKNMTSKEAETFLLENVDKKIIERVEADMLAKEFGIELPASAYTSPAKSKAEQVIAQGFFGDEIRVKYEKAVKDFSKKVDDIQSKAPTSGELGEDIVSQFKKVEVERQQIIDDLYSTAENMIKDGRSVYVDAKETRKFLNEIKKRKELSAVSSPSEIDFIKKIENGLANVNLDVHRATLKDIGEKANFDNILNPTTDEKIYRELYGKLKNDIDNSIGIDLPELKPTLKAANKAFKEFQELKGRPFAQSIAKLGKSGDFDTLADRLTRTKVSTNEIKQIYKTLGKETKTKIQNKIIYDILEKSKSAKEGFTPSGFSSQLKNIGDERLIALLEPNQIQLLKNLDKINKLIDRAGSLTKGSQTFSLQQMGRILAAPATGGTSVGAEWLASKILNTKTGQTWLKGFDDALAENIKRELLRKAAK